MRRARLLGDHSKKTPSGPLPASSDTGIVECQQIPPWARLGYSNVSTKKVIIPRGNHTHPPQFVDTRGRVVKRFQGDAFDV